jgi:phage terminase large subunit-like protein
VLYQLAHPVGSCDVYSVATKEDIAKTVLRDCVALLRTAPNWSRYFRPRHKTLTHSPTTSELRPLGSDSDTLDGLRPEVVVLDELHAWKDRGLWDVMNSAFGAAHSPLMLQITTEGADPCGLLKEQDDRVRAILEAVERGTYTGEKADEGIYMGCLWQPDKTDKWDAVTTWHKANPSLGTVKDMSEMLALLPGARASPGARRDFLVKQLNVRPESGPTRWLDPIRWARCHTGAPLAVGVGWQRLRGLRFWCGLDLASVGDLSAFCALAEDPSRPGVLLCAWRFWLPAEGLADRAAADGQPYDLWASEGWLDLSPGEVVNVNTIESDIVAQIAALDGELVSFAYDPGWEQGAAQRLQDQHNLPMLQCPQRYNTMSAPLASIERAVIAARLDHGAHPIAERHAHAATVMRGKLNGMLLAKGQSKGRIDGMAALAMAEAARLASLSAPEIGAGVFMA